MICLAVVERPVFGRRVSWSLVEARLRFVCFALMFSILFVAVGCAFLDKLAPDQKGNPVAQAGTVMQNVANDPAAKAVAGAVPYGDTVLYILGGIGALLGGVAGIQTKRHADDHKEVKRLREMHAKLHTQRPVAAELPEFSPSMTNA